MLRVLSIYLFLLPIIGFTEIAGFDFESEVQEKRFRDLSSILRCMVCQNQSLSDSNSGLASDLRNELYQQIIQNKSEEQIIEFMTKRYGDFILYKPRFTTKTSLLWLSPLLLFCIALYCLFKFAQNHRVPEEAKNDYDN